MTTYPPPCPTDPHEIFNTIEALRVVFLKTANTPPSCVWLGPLQRAAMRNYWNRLGGPTEQLDETLRGWDVAGLTVRASDRPEIRVGLSIPHDYLTLCKTYDTSSKP